MRDLERCLDPSSIMDLPRPDDSDKEDEVTSQAQEICNGHTPVAGPVVHHRPNDRIKAQ